MTQRRVVDRQRLDHLLTRSRCPVGHLLQILEFTDTEALGTPQREHRHCHAGTFPAGLSATEATVVLHDHLTFLHTPYLAVLAPFGIHYSTALKVINHIFVLHDVLPFDLYVGAPQRELGVVHYQLVVGIPVAQSRAVADDSHALRRKNLRQVNRETDIALCRFRFRGFVTVEKGFHECRRIETVLVGAGLPCVAHHNAFVGCFQGQLARIACFVNETAVLQTDSVFVLDTACEITHRHIRLPEIDSLAGEYQRRFLGPSQNRLLRLYNAQTLPILGTIMNLKIDVHDIVFLVYFRYFFMTTLSPCGKFGCKFTKKFSLAQIFCHFFSKKAISDTVIMYLSPIAALPLTPHSSFRTPLSPMRHGHPLPLPAHSE